MEYRASKGLQERQHRWQWDCRLRKPDPHSSLEAGGKSRPCASLDVVKEVSRTPQGPAQLVTSAALMFWVWLVSFCFPFLRLTHVLELY